MVDQPKSGGVTRRGVLAGAALFGLGAGLDRLVTDVVQRGDDGSPADGATGGGSVPFFGSRQAGIATMAPEFISIASFDLISSAPEDLRALLQEWTVAAAALTKGEQYRSGAMEEHLAPPDPGEASGLSPARLTITFGFGPSLFGIGDADRFGLGSRRPVSLAPLPVFSGDSLEPVRSGGDLCVQACADHPQVAFHAIHTLALIASGTATLRWSQDGFGRTSSTSRDQPTPRNLAGFKDGTNNIRAEDAEAMEEHVWVQPGDRPDWMAGGTYMVARRIKILFDVWDATSLEGQEQVIGRDKLSGAPLGGESEHDPVDLDASQEGAPVIPSDAHVRLSSPEENGGRRILRRGYSFSEAAEPGSGQIEAGLFFISFQRDPQQFIALQRRLSASDALNRHILHTASAVFACPPGARPGGFVGEGLFA